MYRLTVLILLSALMVGPAFAEVTVSDEYKLLVSPREDSTQKDPETGAEQLFLTRGEHKDTHLYFHQRSWMADSSLIFFNSNREKGGLMGYVVETGELVQITAADGAKVGCPTAAKYRNSVFVTSNNRILEIALKISVKERKGGKHATVTAVERYLCTISGIDSGLNENSDGRYLAAGGGSLNGEGKASIALIDTNTGAWEHLCGMPTGVTYHGHVQWSMTNPHWISFAGDPDRLWVVDIRDRKPWCPYRQGNDGVVTHESWWVNDQILFCGGIHQKPTEDSHLKLIDMRAGTIRIIGEGSWWPNAEAKDIAKRNWWHASGSEDGRWVAGDNWHGDIMLFDSKTARPHSLTTGHRTYGKGEHPEVGWDRKGRQVLFGSHKVGDVTVCITTIPEAWQRELSDTLIGVEAK